MKRVDTQSAGVRMRAMQVTETGGPLVLAEVDRPDPGPGEALVRVHACGINFADTLMAAGRYQERPPLPFSPGMEICGTVVALGAGARGPAPGTRVACLAGSGGLADYAVVPADRCLAVPAALPDAEAAGFIVAYGTSHVALSWLARLRPGETLLVTGAAGGVGLTAVEIGHLLGARVIAVARGAAKQEAARAAGADHVLDSGADIRAEVRALGGADVTYETVGEPLFTAALRATNRGGRILPLGFAGGGVPKIPANLLLVKNLTVFGFYFAGFVATAPDVFRNSMQTLFAWHTAGRLRPHVSHVLPLAEAEAALDLLRARAAAGKVIVRVA